MESGSDAKLCRLYINEVVQPLGVGHTLRVFHDLVKGTAERELVPEDGNIVLPPESYPSLDALRRRRPAS